MKITKEWLRANRACGEGVVWFENQSQTDTKSVVKSLMADGRFSWANWLVTKKMDRANGVKYAIYVAEKVLHIYEEKYPGDDRPRKAISAARRYLKTPSEKNRAAARDARAAADSAADAADFAVYAAARAAANVAAEAAARAAARAADAADFAVYAAARAAANVAADAAARAAARAAEGAEGADFAVYVAARAAKIELQKKLIIYGLKLLSQQEEKP
jgi:hypothetical protein